MILLLLALIVLFFYEFSLVLPDSQNSIFIEISSNFFKHTVIVFVESAWTSIITNQKLGDFSTKGNSFIIDLGAGKFKIKASSD